MRYQARLCPNCGTRELEIFYQVRDVPVYDVRLMRSREDALNIPRGDIRLGICATCGFISNTSFDPARLSYNEEWEETQGESKTFRAFHMQLAESLVNRYALMGGSVLEIGCGKGEFLEQLARAGCKELIGFDPAYVPGRISDDVASSIEIHARDFNASDGPLAHDLVCCKMTLEHIAQTRSFIKMLRCAMDEKHNTAVFFMLPDMQRILSSGLFWDIFYEHCSYFTSTSLAYLFGENQFDVQLQENLFSDQYLSIHARAANNKSSLTAAHAKQLEQLLEMARHFSDSVDQQRVRWQRFLGDEREAGRRVVVWGGGSKAVSFLSTMQAGGEIDYIIDINPRKQGCFLPGTGHPVVAPEKLQTHKAGTVIVMNPVYLEEITEMCRALKVAPTLLTIEGGAR